MSDVELLELAAKAAGMPPPYDANDVFTAWIPGKDPHSEYGHWWDPINDDGDALRLALSLSFDLVFDCYQPKHGDLHRSAFRIRIWAKGWVKEDFDRDGKNAAVRLAIVRAAAEIGRTMP